MQDLIVLLWIILYTKVMKVNRSQFITICLVILLLCDDVAMPRRSARRHRAHRSHRSKRRGRRCKPAPQIIYLTFPGCRRKEVHTVGCSGRCKSETSMMLKGRGIVPKCSCCKPDIDKQTTFRVFITCRKAPLLRNIKLLAARSCSCYPCGNCAMQFI